jgi:2-amino-4-hydroxy-6-hydroxymethyldihydropteridine diphosphokinase
VSVRAVLSLGSNLDDRVGYVRAAISSLGDDPRTEVDAVSSLYETDPVGVDGQDSYVNAVVVVTTTRAPAQLLVLAHELEARAARLRPHRWAPRTLDVDIVSVDDLVSDDPTLTLPHPRAHERAFVLVPWLEIDPHASLPGRGTVEHLVAGLDTGGVRLLASPRPGGVEAT